MARVTVMQEYLGVERGEIVGAGPKRLRGLAAVITLVAATACSSSDSPSVPKGSAFPTGRPLTVRISVAPGDGWAYMIADARNRSPRTVDLQEVDLTSGEGSDHISVDPAQVAPLPADPDDQPHGWTPSGIFKTDPPTLLIPGGNCNVQELVDVPHYLVEPGDEVRFLFVMHSRTAGTSTFPSFRVTYTEDGKMVEQSFPTTLVVRSNAGHALKMGYAEKPCAHLAQVLPSGT